MNGPGQNIFPRGVEWMKDFSEWGLLLFSLKNCEMLQCSMSMSLLKILSLNLPPTVKLWKWKAGGLSLQAPGWKRKMSRSWISVAMMRMWAHSLGWGDGLYQLWLNSAATKKKPSKEWFKQRTGTVSQVIMGDPGSFCLITLCVWLLSSWLQSYCSPTDLLSTFQERKEKGQMHESILFWKAFPEAPSSDFCQGWVTWSHLAARESRKEIISARHIASLSKILVPSLRRNWKMAIG